MWIVYDIHTKIQASIMAYQATKKQKNDEISSTATSLDTQPPPRTQRMAKKQQRVVMLQDIRVKDFVLKPLVKSSKCNIVPLAFESDGKSTACDKITLFEPLYVRTKPHKALIRI